VRSFFPVWDTPRAESAHRSPPPRANTFARPALPASLARVKLRHALPCVLLAALAAGCAHTGGPAAGGPGDRLVSLATFDGELLGRAIFEESNRMRAANGARQLAPHPALAAAAGAQATWMALVFSAQHGNPAPGEHNAAERVQSAGLVGPRVGENVVMVPAQRPAGSPHLEYTYAELGAELVRLWMSSPGHRANLLDPGFAYLGCAARAARGALPGDQRVFAAQVFCTTIFKDEPVR
jgi:uncharacterized protein YkwD